VEVVNPKTNKKVIVKVNDFMSDNARDVIDLSYAAALQIDLIRAGRAQVTIRAVSPGNSVNPVPVEKEAAIEKPDNNITPVVEGNVQPAAGTDQELQQKYAKKVNVAPEKITNIALFRLIDSWWGTQYKTPPGPNPTPKTGIDCSGFSALLLSSVFGKKVDGNAQNLLDVYCRRIPRDSLMEGDLVFFCCSTSRRNDRTYISHVGVYLQNGMFVHATSERSAARGNGLMITTLDDPYYWKDKFITGGRVK
jgi:cell wall-associated NlpC family hydrolase